VNGLMSEAISPRVMRRFRDGDPGAVRTLYQRYSRPVFTVAYRALGDRGLAEEAVQQTFLQAWRGAAGFDTQRDPGPWLYAIARRVAVDLFRRERRHQSSDTDELGVAVLPDSFEGAWEAWEVRSALTEVPEEEREILHAIHYLGYSQRETAERLGIPVGTVKSRSHRAHRRLATMLSHLREATA
jgi:RNA polymerase sigma-70 factor (ECF subfamily)